MYVLLSITPVISAAITVVVLYLINKSADLPGQGPYIDGYNLVSTSDLNNLIDNNEPEDCFEV